MSLVKGQNTGDLDVMISPDTAVRMAVPVCISAHLHAWTGIVRDANMHISLRPVLPRSLPPSHLGPWGSVLPPSYHNRENREPAERAVFR